MRILFIFINLALFVLFCLLVGLHFTLSPPPRDKVLDRTPDVAEDKITAAAKTAAEEELPDSAAIVEHNLFHPARGGNGDSSIGAAPQGVGKLELVGLCGFGEIKGANFLIDSGDKARKISSFFNVGDTIANTGYTLIDVDFNSGTAVVSGPGGRHDLHLEHGDKQSQARKATAKQPDNNSPGKAIPPKKKPRVLKQKPAAGKAVKPKRH